MAFLETPHEVSKSIKKSEALITKKNTRQRRVEQQKI